MVRNRTIWTGCLEMAFLNPDEWQPTDGINLEDAAERVVKSQTNKSVIAGPGAGKTELLAQRAVFLLQTGLCKPPQRILAISFKKDAAKTLKDRVSSRCPAEQASRFDSFTFDAFAKSLLDRFLALAPDWSRPPRDYGIYFPSRDEWLDFLNGLEPPAELGGEAAAQALRLNQIEHWGPLPLEFGPPADMRAWVAREWWEHCLNMPQARITFSMINRLAEAILAHNPGVSRALRLTYSHVFLDEFQDTTGPQYRLTRRAFHGSNAVMTAVGDTKQRIMTWAGAESEIFDWFDEHFEAEREMLQMNHRSNARIVQIINDLVTEIEPDAVQTICARAHDDVPEDASEFWIFTTDDEESDKIADFIEDEIAGGRNPDDFALLVRVRANEAEDRLQPFFADRDIRLRNEARSIAGTAIQELLSDEVVNLILGFIRLALGVRGQEVYRPVQEIIGAILGTDFDSPRDVKRLDERSRHIVAFVKQQTDAPPADTDMEALVNGVIEAIEERPLRRVFRQYEDDRYFRQLLTSLSDFMTECAAEADDWKTLIDAVEGKGQVRLMTVHKSKGLEYHTVIFVGLHQEAFWAYQRNQEEETNAFFVALSRARERVYFTQSRESGGTARIRGLIDLLAQANVPIVEFEAEN